MGIDSHVLFFLEGGVDTCSAWEVEPEHSPTAHVDHAPSGLPEADKTRILESISQACAVSEFEAFTQPVDYESYPNYCQMVSLY